ncbi:MAG: 4Fe-4S dicluster domain-containing protein [Smithellaceae bacterium]|nr:4Fe-4S dicluster domain-containing protein [Smithellaceae bacterium]
MEASDKKTRVSEKFPGVQWRGDGGNFITVEAEKCTGCGDCMKVCLGECYEIADKKARIKNLDLCMECGSCWYVCSQDAVRFSWPKGGTGFRTDWG